ncbi:MAG: PAS domain S-box protein [Caedimonadaceae bacterium]|nr:MAG: PAS domain S-box protein [Caedimonadaceae bacterium]
MKKITTHNSSKQSLKQRSHHQDEIRQIKYVIQNVPASMAVFDNHLRFITASDRFFENSPLKKESVKPFDHWYDLIPDMPSKWKKIHQRCLKGERLKCEEDTFYREDGTLEWWRWEVVPLFTTDQKVEGIILFAENVTSQKNTEKNLKHMVQLLNASNATLSTFAHECAHDLCAPLRTLSNFIDLLKESLAKKPEKAYEYAQQIKQNAAYMTSLIKKTLDCSQSDMQRINAEWFHPNEILKNLTEVLKDDLTSSNAEISWSFPTRICADKVLICQVFQNLIMNALTYRSASRPHINIKLFETDSHWVFHVEDNGPGIEEEQRERIFEPYERGENDISGSGLGIGLYKCKKIITSHGGHICVLPKSEGATFEFTIKKNDWKVKNL